jgi:hypothetical protein
MDLKVLSQQLRTLSASAVPFPAPLELSKLNTDRVRQDYIKQTELATVAHEEKKRLERKEIHLRDKISWITKRQAEDMEKMKKQLR